METLVVVAQHRDQYYSRSKSQGHARFGSSSPSRDFRGINCRTFQTGSGILPTPLKPCASPPVTKQPPSSASPSASFQTPFTTPNSSSDNKTRSKTSTPVPINDKDCKKERTFTPDGRGLLLSELWAGPTYSNSPPPSSLPMPKFSVRPKRTVSLDLPGSCPEIEMRKVANSAPSSPRRGDLDSTSPRDFFVNADSATKTLCRILNLNLDDE